MVINNPTSKRDKLLKSALTLFAQQGIHNTSTSSIAKHANVANGTLFHHFENKQTLIEALYTAIKQELSQSVVLTQEVKVLSIKQQARYLWNMSIDWGINNSSALIFCQQVASENVLPLSLRLNAMKEELSILEIMIKAGQRQGEIANYPLDLMLEHCQSHIITSGLFFINNSSLRSDDVYRQGAFDMFWQAIATNE